MAKQNNLKIRFAITESGLTYYKVASLMGISDNTLFRRLREELPEEEQDRIVKLIKEAEQNGADK